jgi:peptide/nickel transport system permease protein
MSATVVPRQQLDAAPHSVAHGRSPAREAMRLFLRNPSGMAGLAILLGIAVATLAGPYFYPVDPFDIAGGPFTPPGDDPILGTDYLGRDVLAGLLHGGRATMTVGLVAAAITVLIGVSIGALAGFFGDRIDAALMKVTEFFQVLPTLLFAMVLVTLFGQHLSITTIAIGVVSWPPTARLTRAEFLRVRGLDYVKAARAAGAGPFYLMGRVILPNAAPPVIVAATLAIGTAILFEGGLSFLGLGDPNVMSWGLMLGQNREYALDAWWTVLLPGGAIFLAVLAVSLVGDAINDALNPRFRKRQ